MSPLSRSEIMKRVPRANTGPELTVRKILHSLGARYRLHVRTLPGSPDIVLPGRFLCIFVHGCFWHRHPGCRLTTTPATNITFWQDKFFRNIARDARVNDELQHLGWRVETIWECETRDTELLTLRLNALLAPHSHPSNSIQ
jgi:DNA mismatch endonuclease (patch repair protein)